MNEKIIRELENLVIDNPQLDELETLIAEFNIFESMGTVRQELRHSDFLAFLLDPSGKHGLDDIFLKRFLIRVLSVAAEPPISPIAINVTNLSGAIVERETQNIDIVIYDTDSGLICVIENKIFSYEHSDQLNRYLEVARSRFPNATAIIPVFLTPDGIPPEDEDSPYIPLSYGQVADMLDQMRQRQESMLGVDVNTMMRHYVTMLRRHIVSDSDVAELCRQIYKSHKAAIDLIVEHMPDQQQELADQLAGRIAEYPDIAIVRHIKSYVDFVPKEWRYIPEFSVGVGLGSHGPFTITFQFYNSRDRLTLYLTLGPVQTEHEYIREAFFEYANAHPEVFKGCRPKLSKKWTILYKMLMLRSNNYHDASVEDLMAIVNPKLDLFMHDVLPKIQRHLMEIEFNDKSVS
jgi:hypothetical protein